MLDQKSSQKKKKILILAGGTGGHIVPGLALFQEFYKQNEEVFFLTLYKNKNYPDFHSLELKKILSKRIFFYLSPPLPTSPTQIFDSKNNLSFFKKIKKLASYFSFLFLFTLSCIQALYIIKRNKITNIVGMGGYPTLPALILGLILRKKIALCEQNTVAGKVTRIFARFANQIFINFPLSRPILNEKESEIKVHALGNPLRENICKSLGTEVGLKQKDSQKKYCILILGGSQGAHQINAAIQEMIALPFPLVDTNIEWVWQCGAKDFEKIKKEFPKSKYPQLTLLDYITNIETYYKKADIIVCRCGAGVLSEALCFGVPLLLVPYPFAADNHQKINAEYLVKNNAGILLSETKGSLRDELHKNLENLLTDSEFRKRMGEAALHLSKKDAASKIAEKILN